MTDIQRFGELMKGLSYFYRSFDLSDKEITVWYKALQDLEESELRHLLKEFTNNSAYPPQSPTHIRQGGINTKYIVPEPKWMKQANDRKQLTTPLTEEEIQNTQKLLDSFK